MAKQKFNIIGKSVIYTDFLGVESYGRIVAVEPYHDDIYYVYIEDEDTSLNVHRDTVDGEEVTYAEIRPSDQVYLDKK